MSKYKADWVTAEDQYEIENSDMSDKRKALALGRRAMEMICRAYAIIEEFEEKRVSDIMEAKIKHYEDTGDDTLCTCTTEDGKTFLIDKDCRIIATHKEELEK